MCRTPSGKITSMTGRWCARISEPCQPQLECGKSHGRRAATTREIARAKERKIGRGGGTLLLLLPAAASWHSQQITGDISRLVHLLYW